MSLYVITVHDHGHIYERREQSNFTDTLAAVADIAAQWPAELIDVCNYEDADYDTDGLTAEERAAIRAVTR